MSDQKAQGKDLVDLGKWLANRASTILGKKGMDFT